MTAIPISHGRCGNPSPVGTGRDITDDSILLLAHALGTLQTCGTLISQTPALRIFPFLSGEVSEKSCAFGNDVTASKSVFGPSVVMNSKRLSQALELSRCLFHSAQLDSLLVEMAHVVDSPLGM